MKILIVKSSALGDIIHTFPALHYLRCVFPKAQIDWVVEKHNQELLERHSELDRLYVIDSRSWRRGKKLKELRTFAAALRKEHYDWLFDLQGNCKSGLVTLIAHAKKKVGFGRKSVTEWPNLLATHLRIDPPAGLTVREDLLFVVKKSLQKEPASETQLPLLTLVRQEELQIAGLEGAVVVCVGSRWPNKQLGEKAWLRQLDKTEGKLLFCWGTDEEQRQAARLAAHFPGRARLLEKLSLPALQHLMAKSRLVLAVDSLPLHLAATTMTPTVSFFGPSSAKKYAPSGSGHQSEQGACPYGVTFERRCPRLRNCPTGACMRAFDRD